MTEEGTYDAFGFGLALLEGVLVLKLGSHGGWCTDGVEYECRLFAERMEEEKEVVVVVVGFVLWWRWLALWGG
jgi:hypothetical protein